MAPGGRSDGAATAPAVNAGWQRLGGSLVYRGRSEDNSQAWLLTLTDLMALMLTFFVMLFSMSSIEQDDWQDLVGSLSPRLDRLQEVTVLLPQSDKAAQAVERAPGTDLDYLAAVLQEQMKADPMLQQARVARESHRLVISVPGDLLFASGSTELGKAGEKAVFALSGVLRSLHNVIEIAGYADPQPPHGIYPTNWELSLARAAALSGLLTELGYQGEVLVRGYGHARYQQIDPALPSDERMARARRVDIIVHDYSAELH